MREIGVGADKTGFPRKVSRHRDADAQRRRVMRLGNRLDAAAERSGDLLGRRNGIGAALNGQELAAEIDQPDIEIGMGKADAERMGRVFFYREGTRRAAPRAVARHGFRHKTPLGQRLGDARHRARGQTGFLGELDARNGLFSPDRIPYAPLVLAQACKQFNSPRSANMPDFRRILK